MLKFPTPLLITQSNASERIVIIEKNLSCINAPLEDLKKVFDVINATLKLLE